MTTAPAASRITSALPWSAVMPRIAPGPPAARDAASTARTASAIRPMQPSTTRRPPPRRPRRPCGRPCPGWRGWRRSGRSGPPRWRPRARRSRRPRSSPAAGRRSRPWGWGSAAAPRPARRASTPPLKKYVTWAYFSVSATWNCAPPLRGDHLGEAGHHLRREGDLHRQPSSYSVSVTTRQRGRAALRREARERRVHQRVGQLARPVGAEVEVDDDVAVADGAVHALDDRGLRRTRRSRRARRLRQAASAAAAGGRYPLPVHDRLAVAARRAPSACRGPCPSSGHRWWRCAAPG